MATYGIRLNNSEYGLISRYSIPLWLEDEYVESDSTIYFPGGQVENFRTTTCVLCDRYFTNASKPHKCVSHNLQLNRFFGLPVVLCIDCRYYVEYIIEGNATIPNSFKKIIDDGFTPKNLNRYF